MGTCKNIFLKKSDLRQFLHTICCANVVVIIIIIIIIKKNWQCKAERGRLTPYQSEDPSPTLPTYRGKEEKGKIVEDKKGESIYRPTKWHWTCS